MISMDQEHRLRDEFDREFVYTSWPRIGCSIHEEAFPFYKVYAKQHFYDIVDAGHDPFGYDLQDLWLDVFQRPWAVPTDQHKIIDDLAQAVENGDLFVYVEEEPFEWQAPGRFAGEEDDDAPMDQMRTATLPYTPHPDVKEPKAGDRIFKRLHPNGDQSKDAYTIQADGKPMGAGEGRMPENMGGMKKPPPNHDQLVDKGWPNLNFNNSAMYATFTHVEPVQIPPGTKIFRVVDEKNNDAGPFWSYSMATNKARWRKGSAVKDAWNDNGYFVEYTVGPQGLKAWKGPAAGQQYEEFEGREFYLAGGDTQLFITPGTMEPTAPKLTDWPEL